MSAPVSGPIAIGALDLAALLCSRVCHDLISPVGAIVNGIEVMEEDKDEETKTFALDLIKKSAYQASAKLQFCRLAFGAAGSAGAQIDLGDAEKAARGLLEDDKTKITLESAARIAGEEPGETVVEHAADRRGAIPRGGTLTVDPAPGMDSEAGFAVTAAGLNARLNPTTGDLMAGTRPGRRRPRHSTSLCGHPRPGLRAHAFGRRRRRRWS